MNFTTMTLHLLAALAFLAAQSTQSSNIEASSMSPESFAQALAKEDAEIDVLVALNLLQVNRAAIKNAAAAAAAAPPPVVEMVQQAKVDALESAFAAEADEEAEAAGITLIQTAVQLHEHHVPTSTVSIAVGADGSATSARSNLAHAADASGKMQVGVAADGHIFFEL